MNHPIPDVEVRQTPGKGRGVFARGPIFAGQLVAVCSGEVVATADLQPEHFAMQVGPDLWLCSLGESLDDCCNHSCEPNLGFLHGTPALYALREIAVGEELCWDYSTSLDTADWGLECLCETPSCRRMIRSFGELGGGDRARLLPIALNYLRAQYAV